MPLPALSDPTLRHAVHLERLKSGQVRAFLPFLKRIDRELRERLTRDGLTEFARDRLETMLREIDAMLAAVLGDYGRRLQLDLEGFAAYEAGFTGKLLENAGFAASVPAAVQVWAAATSEPLQAGKGKLLAPFIKDWTDSEREAVTGAIRLAAAQGQTVAQTVRVIRGTRAAGYADGLLAITSRHAEAVTRTALAHVGAVARAETYAANADIIAGEQWNATLDQRTCVRCGSLDNRTFKRGKGPMEPLHVNCRCVRIPLLSDEFRFLDEGAKRSSIDGPVDAGTSYFAWLKQQPAAFQDSVLGPSRGALLRNGGLTAERFAQLQLDRRWEALTLDELRELDPVAFTRAGI